jgi:hypothetical protein
MISAASTTPRSWIARTSSQGLLGHGGHLGSGLLGAAERCMELLWEGRATGAGGPRRGPRPRLTVDISSGPRMEWLPDQQPDLFDDQLGNVAVVDRIEQAGNDVRRCSSPASRT